MHLETEPRDGSARTQAATDVLIRIARCRELARADSPTSPCYTVVGPQRHLGARDRQVPEPWRGSTEAPLLFISSNPSLDPDDDCPRAASTDKDLISYFGQGFPTAFPRIRLRSGELRSGYVRFWAHIRARAAELLGVDRHRIRPGIDFAITELVHCKSIEEVGVRNALRRCVSLHWAHTQRVMKARVFVAVGAVAGSELDIKAGDVRKMSHPHGGTRWLLALPHPNAFDMAGKTFRERYAENDLQGPKDTLRVLAQTMHV